MKYCFNICCLLISSVLFCQNLNVLTSSEFNGITIDGVTLEELKLTNGNPSAMEELFYEITYSFDSAPASGISYLIHESLAIYFQDQTGTGQLDILSIFTSDARIAFRIKEVDLSVGSDVSQFKRALGPGQTFIEGNGYHKIVLTTENMSASLGIKYSPETNKILEFKYAYY